MPHPDDLLPLDLNTIAFMLDIDGTLLNLAPTPREVWVPPELQASLRILYDKLDGAIAFVSGRSVSDIDVIFSPLVLPAVGGHGAEFRADVNADASGPPPMPRELRRSLATVNKIAPGILVEDKGYAMALHYRLAPDKGAEVESAIEAICAGFPDAAVEILHGKLVVEIKPAGHTKASGIRALMQSAPFKGRRPIFIGDDVTDEVVFPMLPEFDGLGFSVGRSLEGTDGCFDDPGEVRAWLHKIASHAAQSARAAE